MSEDIKVTFDAFKVPDGTDPQDIRVVIPKSQYLVVAEDDGCYYLQPVPSLTPHAMREEGANGVTDDAQSPASS